MMAADPVVLDRPEPHVARVLINRPEKRNAIDLDVRSALLDTVAALQADATVRALVIGGAGGTFSSGGDVPSMIGLSEHDARERMRHVHRLCRLVAGLRIPVVSAVEGVAAGGGVGLALLGDFIVVGASTKLLLPFLKLGLTPDWGLLYTLPRRVGLPAARRILTAGKAIGGPEALAIGLADEQADDARVMDAALAQAAEWSLLPHDAFARMKARLNDPSATLDAELAREENDQVACFAGDEFAEGHAAFSAKRRPDFVGRPKRAR